MLLHVDLHTLAVSIVSILARMGWLVGDVVEWWVVLCTVVANVCGARSPKVAESALGFKATEPMELHVHYFRFTRDDCLVGNFNCCVVITLDRCFGLWPAQFDE